MPKMSFTSSQSPRHPLSATALFIDSLTSIPADKEASRPYNAHINLGKKTIVFSVAMVIIGGICKPDFYW